MLHRRQQPHGAGKRATRGEAEYGCNLTSTAELGTHTYFLPPSTRHLSKAAFLLSWLQVDSTWELLTAQQQLSFSPVPVPTCRSCNALPTKAPSSVACQHPINSTRFMPSQPVRSNNLSYTYQPQRFVICSGCTHGKALQYFFIS